MKTGDVVVHKALGNEPLVVVPNDSTYSDHKGLIKVRRAKQTKNGTTFVEDWFHSEELETPLESMDREALIFEALTAKKNAINAKQSTGIGHLN